MSKKRIKYAMLVYQGGIANVFAVDCLNLSSFGRNAKRLIQSDFVTCRAFARGMGVAGCIVRTAWCNMAGDITDCTWTEDVEDQPFSDRAFVVKEN